MKELTQLESVLRNRFQKVDIRSDQCDIIRMISPSISAGCLFSDGRYEAKVISLKCEVDFDTKLLASFECLTPEGLADSLAEYFEH